MQSKSLNSLREARTHLELATYLLEVTLKIIDDKRILTKCLSEMQKTAGSIIDAVIFLYSEKLSRIPNGKEERAHLFFNKVAERNLKKEETEELKKILLFAKLHKNAKLEFVRGEKLVIFGEKKCQIVTEKGVKNSINALNNIIFRFEQKT